jgi:ankyrin repeat protein
LINKKRGMISMLRFLTWRVTLGCLACAALLHASSSGHDTARLLDAAADGRLAEIKEAIDGGFDPDTLIELPGSMTMPFPTHETMLFVAARENKLDTARYLLENGADPNVINTTDNIERGTALTIAASRFNRVMVVKVLLEHGAEPLGAKPNGQDAMQWAATHGNFAAFLMIREAALRSGMSREHDHATLELLILRDDRWADFIETVIRMDDLDEPPLARAIIRGDAAVVREALDSGADPNAADKHGWTPLHWASITGRIGLVNAMLDAGADVHRETKHGMTVLMAAVHGADTEVVEAVIAAGGDIDATDKKGRTVLHFAAQESTKQIILLLIEHGADVHARENEGITPMDVAALRRDYMNEDLTDAFAESSDK